MTPQLQARPPQPAAKAAPELGVIEEARKRRHARRRRIAVSIPAVALALGLAAVLSGGGSHAPSRDASRPTVARTGAGRSAGVTITPALTGGSYGWTVMAGGGGTCCTMPVKGNPLAGETGADSRDGYEVASFLSGPELSAVLLKGRRLPMRIQRLPFGLRLVQVTIVRSKHSGRYGPATGWPPVQLTALDARGRPLPRARVVDGPAVTARWWRRPQPIPAGPCGLQAHGLPGLSAQWGHVASAILPFGAPIVGRAFFSCIDTEYYFQKWPFDAAILVDAQHPGAVPAPLPGMTPVSGAPGYYDAPAQWREAGTARRLGDAWLLLAGGRDLAQRLEVLRHLTATVALRR